MNRGRNTAILAVAGRRRSAAYIFFVETPARAGADGDAPAGAARQGVRPGRRRQDRGDRRSPPAAASTTTLRKVNNAWQLVAPIAGAGRPDRGRQRRLEPGLGRRPARRRRAAQGPRRLRPGQAAHHDHLPVAGDKDAADAAARRQEPDRQRPLRQAARRSRACSWSRATSKAPSTRATFGFRDKRDPDVRSREGRSRSPSTAPRHGGAAGRHLELVKQPWAARADFGVIESVLSRLPTAR